MIGCWKAKMMLAHLLIKKSNCISVLLAVQGPLAQNVLEKAIAGVHLDALQPFDLVITIFWNNGRFLKE